MPNQHSDQDLPPQPRAILRGHRAQVHAAVFIRSNQRLLTGDADGFVVAWDLAIMRPQAVWQAHGNAILGMSEWRPDRVITHGRDNRLIVWRLTSDDESAMSSTLPVDPAPEPRPKPWMLHLLEVNTMNFCTFASCPAAPLASIPPSELLVAVPNTLASEAVDIYLLPSQARVHTVRLGADNGMAMALSLAWLSSVLTLIVGYENGLAVVAQLDSCGGGFWAPVYRNNSHSQPILSLDVAPGLEYFLTSGADALIAKHPLPPHGLPPQGLIRDATKTTLPAPELNIAGSTRAGDTGQDTEHKGSSSSPATALAGHTSATRPQAPTTTEIHTRPVKVADTKHSGQQSLRIRSDGLVFATAGWDSRVRVYSTKSMREVAVLKWHTAGCFSVAFADLMISRSTGEKDTLSASSDVETSLETRIIPPKAQMTVRQRRVNQALNGHWLAAGSKDGKVSLWDVF